MRPVRHWILLAVAGLAMSALLPESSIPAEPGNWGKCISAPTDQCMLSIARKIAVEERYDSLRAELFGRIAIVQAEKGQISEAHQVMEMAEEAARDAPREETVHLGDDRATAWATVARGWVKTGAWDRAFRLSEDAPDESARAEVARAITKGFMDIDNTGEAWKFVGNLAQLDLRLGLLLEIAEAQIDTGNLTEVRDTLATIRRVAGELPRDESNAYSLAQLGKLQADAGLIDEARETAAEITGSSNYDWLVRQIALAQARSGDFHHARETLGMIEEKVGLVLGYARVGSIAVAAGDRKLAEDFFAEGLKIAGATASDTKRDQAIGRVAWYRAEAGDYDQAVVLLAEIGDSDIRDWITRVVVGEMIERDSLDEALAAAGLLSDLVHRARAYTEIAAAHSASGEHEAADKVFALALETTAQIADGMSRDICYAFIAEKQAKAGDFASALKAVGSVQSVSDLNGALAGIAVQMARAGDLPGAMTLLERIGPNWVSAEALVRIASPDEPDR